MRGKTRLFQFLSLGYKDKILTGKPGMHYTLIFLEEDNHKLKEINCTEHTVIHNILKVLSLLTKLLKLSDCGQNYFSIIVLRSIV